MMTQKPAIAAPRRLRAPTRRWYEQVATDYVLEGHHLKLLELAGMAWDRGVTAEEALKAHGQVFEGKGGAPRARPEAGIARDAALTFARLIRELGLDVEAPNERRPPVIRGNAALRVVP